MILVRNENYLINLVENIDIYIIIVQILIYLFIYFLLIPLKNQFNIKFHINKLKYLLKIISTK
jgi:hypothetical protein